MTEMTTNAEFSTEAPLSLDQARLQVLDSFFELEVALGRWARALGHKDANAPFGQRLRAVCDDTNLPQLATQGQFKFFRALSEKLANVLKVRNAVVHSRTSIGTFKGKRVIFFETPSLTFADEGAVIPLDLEMIRQTAAEAKSIASQLSNFLKQNAAASKSEGG